jgi:hypothetical protein
MPLSLADALQSLEWRDAVQQQWNRPKHRMVGLRASV